MTRQDAETVASVVAEADHRCATCVKALVAELQVAFPAFRWRYQVETGTVQVDDDQEQGG